MTDEQFLQALRDAEQARRRIEALDNVLIAELDSRNLAGRLMMRSTQALLSGLLKLAPAEAANRVRQARQLGPRTTLTGEALPPVLPTCAEARADGRLTARHVGVIIEATTRLREAQLPVATVADAEGYLTEQAEHFDPPTLGNLAARLIDTLDPDGRLGDEQAQRRRRCLRITPTGDGMHRLTADLDPPTAALAMAVLHSLAAPKAAREGEQAERDERTGGQRLHDALGSVLRLALRSGELPASGGVPATVLITMTAEQFSSGTGLASTSFGQQFTVTQALRLADEACIGWLVHGSRGGILNYGTTRRIASPGQTLALIARDRGCAFPGCTDPPEWAEKHHITPWSQGGRTDLDNLVLLCDHHHDRIDTGGWQVTMRDGLPWFIPPEWADPERTPVRNQRP